MFSSACLSFSLHTYSTSFTRVPAPPSVGAKQTLFTPQTLTSSDTAAFYFPEVNLV